MLEAKEREILEYINHPVFTESELLKLQTLQKTYQKNVSELSEISYKKELERLAIDYWAI